MTSSNVGLLGDKDDTYWDYLVQLVTPAIESDAPDFMSYDEQGKALHGPSPAFLAWTKTHNASPEAGEDSLYWLFSGATLVYLLIEIIGR